MSNLAGFALASTFLLLFLLVFYFLIKQWTKFHKTILGKVLKIVYSLTLLLAITVSIFIAYLCFDKYWEDDRVRVINAFQGVKLGWSKDEVLFRLGEPSSIDKENDMDFLWGYGSLAVNFKEGKVVQIVYGCQDGNYSYEKVGGISCSADVERVLELYGESLYKSISDDKLARIYNYPQYNVAFWLKKSKVEALGIYDSSKDPVGFEFQSVKSDSPIATSKDVESSAEYISPTIEEIEKYENEKKIEYQAEQKKLNGDTDHCAPNLIKSERLRRLALNGTVRETGYQTYTVGNYEIAFSFDEVISCR